MSGKTSPKSVRLWECVIAVVVWTIFAVVTNTTAGEIVGSLGAFISLLLFIAIVLFDDKVKRNP